VVARKRRRVITPFMSQIRPRDQRSHAISVRFAYFTRVSRCRRFSFPARLALAAEFIRSMNSTPWR
jgi:hypothetical protein